MPPYFVFIKKSGGGGFDPDYQAVLDFATTQGYTLPSEVNQAQQSDLIKALKSAGIWDKLDVYYCFATNGDSDFATLNWIDPTIRQATKVNAPTFIVNEGFKGDAVSAFLNTNYNPTLGTNFIVNSASMGAYIKSIGAASGAIFGDGSGTGADYQFVNSTAAVFQGLNVGGVSYASGDFNHLNSSTTSGRTKTFKNGIQQGNIANGANALKNATVDCLRRKTLGNYSDGTIGLFFAGADIETEAADMYNAWNTYQSSLTP